MTFKDVYEHTIPDTFDLVNLNNERYVPGRYIHEQRVREVIDEWFLEWLPDDDVKEDLLRRLDL